MLRAEGAEGGRRSLSEEAASALSPHLNSIWAILSVLCVVFAALAAGCTMGMACIDPMRLKIKLQIGTNTEKRQAERVLPLLKHQHFLICSLVVFNALANEALPIFLLAFMPSWASLVLSVTAVLLFCEVLPVALFTGPRQLQIASACVPFVLFAEMLFGIISWPLSELLNAFLGKQESSEKFTRDEISAMLLIIRDHNDQNNNNNNNSNNNNGSGGGGGGGGGSFNNNGNKSQQQQQQGEEEQHDSAWYVGKYLGRKRPESRQQQQQQQQRQQQKQQKQQRAASSSSSNNKKRSIGGGGAAEASIAEGEGKGGEEEEKKEEEDDDDDDDGAEEEEDEAPLTISEVNVITGTLGLAKRTCRDVCMPMQRVNMLSSSQRFDDVTIEAIEKVGHSRLPVFKGQDANHVLGFFLVKKLIRVNPDLARPVSSFALQEPLVVGADVSLLDMLAHFQSEHSSGTHLALVSDEPVELLRCIRAGIAPSPPSSAPIGILTIEDIFEAMLQSQIYDESDRENLGEYASASHALREMSLARRDGPVAAALTAAAATTTTTTTDATTTRLSSASYSYSSSSAYSSGHNEQAFRQAFAAAEGKGVTSAWSLLASSVIADQEREQRVREKTSSRSKGKTFNNNSPSSLADASTTIRTPLLLPEEQQQQHHQEEEGQEDEFEPPPQRNSSSSSSSSSATSFSSTSSIGRANNGLRASYVARYLRALGPSSSTASGSGEAGGGGGVAYTSRYSLTSNEQQQSLHNNSNNSNV